STVINKAGQQVPDNRSHIDSDQIKEEHVPSSLSDCFKQENGTLITECVTVKVIDVQRGESGKIFAAAAICDATHACIAKVYNSKNVTIIQPNAVLILENFSVRDGEISITYRTNVYSTAFPLEIPDDIMNKASSSLSGTNHTDTNAHVEANLF
ncbi:uncharacterized protein LOC134261626, partial [Saccostrea cucullata]|uniref:uncharacterized protein LOC134261626 n=1 Tax=Saccostrea cuccullata TaxID=36930 RepID=UPI002ED2DA51